MISTINKIDEYCDDIKKAYGKDVLPNGNFFMKIRAMASYVIWGTSFSEYFGYKFWNRSFAEKKTYMTRRHMFRFFDKYNPHELRERIGNKAVAPQYYGEFLKRDQVGKSDGFEAFSDFCNKYKRIFIKRTVGWGGEGARIEIVDSEHKINDVWLSLTEGEAAEPVIENCEEIRELHPMSLNTVKVTVLMINGKPQIQYALFRIGNNTVVDNVHLGGMGAGVNIETGEVETPAYDKHFAQYSTHPLTNKKILGFKLPYWEDVKAMVNSASCVTPELRYSSWDIAITPNGPVMMEGNWDAEFYAEQMIYNCGNRRKFINLLESGK